MKDMYIDYGGYTGRRNARRRRIRAFLIVLAAAAAVGLAGFAAVRYYMHTIEDQNELSAEPEPVAADTAISDTGVYGVWYEPAGGQDTVRSDYVTENSGWMSDFIDTRVKCDVRALYVASDVIESRLKELIRLADETEINALVIDIKDDKGRVICDIDCPIAEQAGAERILVRDMPALVRELKSHGIYLIARISGFRDPIMAVKRRDLGFKNPDGSVYYDSSSRPWLNPYTEECWDYMKTLGTACAELGFDEINYDYLCFCTESSLKRTDITEAPEGVSRSDVISEGVRELCELLKPMGVFVSCSVYGTSINSSVDSAALGQNYSRLAGYLDYLCPMLYPSHYGRGYFGLDIPDNHPYELVNKLLQNSIKALYMLDPEDNKADVRPWLQDFTAGWVAGHLEYGTDEVRAQIDATYDAGYYQWSLWNPNGIYSTGALMDEN